MNLTVMGLDLALKNTGFAVAETDPKVSSLVFSGTLRCEGRIPGVEAEDGSSIKYEELPALERPFEMSSKVAKVIERYNPDLIVIEGYAYSSPKRTHLPALAEVAGQVKKEIIVTGNLVTIFSPSALKKFATGKGNAKKDQVIAATKGLLGSSAITDNNQADAIWLAAFGVMLMGYRWKNKRSVPVTWSEAQQEVLEKFELPNYGNVFSPREVLTRAKSRKR